MNAVRAVLLALSLVWSFAASADVAVPQLTGPVVDQTDTLHDGDIALMSVKLKDLEKRKGSQIAVLIVPTTEPETIEQYSIRVAEAWKIGRKKIDDGALLVVAKDDHHLRIEVGYGLEGSLTDVTIAEVLPLQPDFVAVRGAVCCDGRDGNLDPAKVRRLARLLQDQESTRPAARVSRA